MSQSTTIVQSPAPAPESSAGEPEHIVQFYDDDSALLDSLTDFVGAGLATSALCLVVATAEHRRGLEARLVAAGYRPDHAEASGRYVALDAAESVARILDDHGVPDPERFERVIGDVIQGPARAARSASSARWSGCS